MKKSELYRKAALVIYGEGYLTPDEFVETIHELMERAKTEAFYEEQAANKAQAEEAAV